MTSVDRLRHELDRLFTGAPDAVRGAYDAAWKRLIPTRPPKPVGRPPEAIVDDDDEADHFPVYRSAPADDYRDPFANPITWQEVAEHERAGYCRAGEGDE